MPTIGYHKRQDRFGFPKQINTQTRIYHREGTMVASSVHDLIGVGVYTPRQAARYARLRTATAMGWLHGNERMDPVLDAQLQDDENRWVTFRDLVQLMAVRAVRLGITEGGEHRRVVSLQLLREAVKSAKDGGYPWAFARRHRTYLFDDNVVLYFPDTEECFGVHGRYKNQHLMHKVIEFYAEDLTYNEETGFAERYVPLRVGDRQVVLDPNQQFGEAMVDPCGYRVETLTTAVETEGGMEAAAHAYGVQIEDVRIAMRYRDWLLGVGP